MNKRADLSLSINAIVVLILAITMLGLGLGFMRNTFQRTTAQFQEVSDTVKNQVTDDIKATNEKLAFNKLEVSLKRGEERDLFYGIRNVLGDPGKTSFSIVPSCTAALKGSVLTIGTGTSAKQIIELGTFGTWTVPPGEVEVLKLTVTANTEASFDTYSCQLRVCEGNAGCPGLGEYSTKKFFVVVS